MVYEGVDDILLGWLPPLRQTLSIHHPSCSAGLVLTSADTDTESLPPHSAVADTQRSYQQPIQTHVTSRQTKN